MCRLPGRHLCYRKPTETYQQCPRGQVRSPGPARRASACREDMGRTRGTRERKEGGRGNRESNTNLIVERECAQPRSRVSVDPDASPRARMSRTPEHRPAFSAPGSRSSPASLLHFLQPSAAWSPALRLALSPSHPPSGRLAPKLSICRTSAQSELCHRV